MSNEGSKRIVEAFFEAFSAGDFEEALSHMAEDGVWITPGKSPFAGSETKTAVLQKLPMFKQLMPSGYALKPTGWTIDGNKVAVEAESHAEVVTGSVYANQYHFLFELEGGKIQTVKEYTCTYHAWEIFSPFLQPGG